MHVTDFFGTRFRAVSRFIISLIASAETLASAFSQRTLSQEVQPLYGVPYPPVVKYGAPSFTVTPIPGPTDVIQGILPGRSYIVAISALAVIVVFAGLGLLYYLSRRKK